MNWMTSTTETSSRLPLRLMVASAAFDQPEQLLERTQLARHARVDPRGHQRRGGVGADQVEQLAVLVEKAGLVREQLEDDERAHDHVLHAQRDGGQRRRAV